MRGCRSFDYNNALLLGAPKKLMNDKSLKQNDASRKLLSSFHLHIAIVDKIDSP